jgi:hypothetical protein
MMKYIVIGVFVIVVLGAAVWYFGSPKGTPGPAQQGNQQVTGQVATSTYATSTFSVVYPSDYSVDESYTYTQVNPNKPIHGVKFTIPGTMATGTNLSSDSYVAVEMLPHAKNCTADIYLAANVKPTTQDEGGRSWSVATSSGAAAGNLYEESVFAIPGSTPCTAVRYFIHSSNIGNYPAGSVQEFDKSALISAFDKIRQSLLLTQ